MQSQVFPSRFLAEVKSEPSRHLPVSPTHPHPPLNLSRLPRDFSSQATLHLCGCNQGAPRRSAGHRLGSETEPREPVTRQTPGPGPLRGYPGFWRNWSVRRKALWNFHLRIQVLGSKLGDTQAFKGWGLSGTVALLESGVREEGGWRGLGQWRGVPGKGWLGWRRAWRRYGKELGREVGARALGRAEK